MPLSKPDSLIFDMDGTLWDATDTYVEAWNRGFKKYGIEKVMERKVLDAMMGWEQKKVFTAVFPDMREEEWMKMAEIIHETQDEILPVIGGTLYDYVLEGIKKLSEDYKLFIVSNCPKNAIKQMISFSKIENYITDEFAHGVNNMPKAHNIKLLMEKHALKNPYYVGDTESDRIQSENAGIPFVFVDYGFGTTDNYDLKFSSFEALTLFFSDLGNFK